MCKLNYPEHLSNCCKDIMKKILVRDPSNRITVEQIKKHPFYLKGKNVFKMKFGKVKENDFYIEAEKYAKTEANETLDEESMFSRIVHTENNVIQDSINKESSITSRAIKKRVSLERKNIDQRDVGHDKFKGKSRDISNNLGKHLEESDMSQNSRKHTPNLTNINQLFRISNAKHSTRKQDKSEFNGLDIMKLRTALNVLNTTRANPPKRIQLRKENTNITNKSSNTIENNLTNTNNTVNLNNNILEELRTPNKIINMSKGKTGNIINPKNKANSVNKTANTNVESYNESKSNGNEYLMTQTVKTEKRNRKELTSINLCANSGNSGAEKKRPSINKLDKNKLTFKTYFNINLGQCILLTDAWYMQKSQRGKTNNSMNKPLKTERRKKTAPKYVFAPPESERQNIYTHDNERRLKTQENFQIKGTDKMYRIISNERKKLQNKNYDKSRRNQNTLYTDSNFYQNLNQPKPHSTNKNRQKQDDKIRKLLKLDTLFHNKNELFFNAREGEANGQSRPNKKTNEGSNSKNKTLGTSTINNTQFKHAHNYTSIYDNLLKAFKKKKNTQIKNVLKNRQNNLTQNF